MIKLLLNFFTAWVSDLVNFPEKGLSTMAAIWPSTERVKTFLKNYVPIFSKINTGCSDVHVIERPGYIYILPNLDPIRFQILQPDGPLENVLLHLSS
jgi:hypothetical protein